MEYVAVVHNQQNLKFWQVTQVRVAATCLNPIYSETNKNTNESKSSEAATVLAAWNPHGDLVNKLENLSGYRYEAIDIIAATNVMQGNAKY